VAAPTVSDDPAVQQQYLAQLALTSSLFAALRALWPHTRPLDSDHGMRIYRDVVAFLVDQFSQAAASIANDFYSTARREAGVPGTPRLPLVASPPRSLVDAGIDWATRAKAEADAYEAAVMARVEAAMQKAVTDTGRAQVVADVTGDEFALGFRRVPRPGACYFCIAMAIRYSTRTRQKQHGKFVHDKDAAHFGVYKTRDSAGAAANSKFEGEGAAKFHDNCHCVIEPVFFHGTSRPPSWLADMAHLYDTYDTEDFGKGLPGFRRALRAHRDGVDHIPADLPPVNPAAVSPQIDALLNLFAKRAA
jgi:hypothetical protein